MSEETKSKKERKPLSKTEKIIIIAIASVVALFLVITCVYSIATEQSPISAIQSVFTSNKDEICAKWQSQEKPGLNAYVFYDDGTYDYYLSNFNFDGDYTIDGNKISLKNPDTEKDLVYKFTIHGDVLTLTLIEADGKAVDSKDQTVTKFDKVDELNMKSLTDMLSNLTTTTTEKK